MFTASGRNPSEPIQEALNGHIHVKAWTIAVRAPLRASDEPKIVRDVSVASRTDLAPVSLRGDRDAAGHRRLAVELVAGVVGQIAQAREHSIERGSESGRVEVASIRDLRVGRGRQLQFSLRFVDAVG